MPVTWQNQDLIPVVFHLGELQTLHKSEYDQLMDEEEFKSDVFQRPFQYLSRDMKKQNLNKVNANNVEGTPLEMVTCLLQYCGIPDPSWAELRHFVWFLNTQLQDTEKSIFCQVEEDLPGFRLFVVKFMIQMSKVKAHEKTTMPGQYLGTCLLIQTKLSHKGKLIADKFVLQTSMIFPLIAQTYQSRTGNVLVKMDMLWSC